MSDTNTPQQSEQPTQPVEQAPAAPQSAAIPAFPPPYQPQPEPPRRRSGWIWGIVALVFLCAIAGSCVWGFSLIGSGGDIPISSGQAIAVIEIDGVIAGSGTTGVITPKSFLEQFEKAEKDDNVKAIVLRVDSPGGTVAASEEVATYVKESTKPVVVAIGDVGASGAYMVSSQAEKIFANPGSAVGSIGVITEIPNVEGLLDKVGVKFTTVTAGKYKDTGSMYRPLTATETALIQGSVDQVYEQFIGIVAEGRNMPRSKVESLATGWAWNGDQAKDLGLVDEIGTYRDALKAAAKLGGIQGEYETITYGSAQFEDLLNSIIGLSERMGPIGSLDSRAVTQPGPALAK